MRDLHVTSRNNTTLRVVAWLCAAVVLAVLQGCASVPNPDARDPFESMNRGIFTFNDAVDRAVAKPVATVYRDVTPDWFRKGVGNFFGNLEDVWSAFNNALQLRGQDTGDSIGRVMVNTTIGLGGLMDVATDLNIDKHPANFGLTLGRWGVKPGPYIVIPFLGPSTLRDVAGLPVDSRGSVLNNTHDLQVRDTLMVVNLVNTRASLLGAGQVVEEAALDKYSFMRDGYLQRRRNQVYDGNPPEEDEAQTPE